MIIGGLQKVSLQDYPGKVSAIIFVRGCNFNCPYCHNPELIDPERFSPIILEEEVFAFLKKRHKVLDGVVITGGEPTIYNNLPEFLKRIKQLKLLVKLDTNGANPVMLKRLLKEKLIDYLAMDIKHNLKRYHLITPVDLRKIKESIKIIMHSGLPYEFRTTVLPKYFKKEDFSKIGQMIKGAKQYFIQQFRPQKTLRLREDEPTFTKAELAKFKKIIDNYVEKCEIR